jgi:hypothetical protein
MRFGEGNGKWNHSIFAISHRSSGHLQYFDVQRDDYNKIEGEETGYGLEYQTLTFQKKTIFQGLHMDTMSKLMFHS